MTAINITEEFPVNIQTAFSVVTDYEHYPDFIDGTDGAKIVERLDNGARVEFLINVMKKFRYVLRFYEGSEGSAYKLTWEFESGDLFSQNSGSWEFEKISENQTRGTYTLDLAFKVKVPKLLLNRLVNNNLPQLMEDYRRRMQEVARE